MASAASSAVSNSTIPQPYHFPHHTPVVPPSTLSKYPFPQLHLTTPTPFVLLLKMLTRSNIEKSLDLRFHKQLHKHTTCSAQIVQNSQQMLAAGFIHHDSIFTVEVHVRLFRPSNLPFPTLGSP